MPRSTATFPHTGMPLRALTVRQPFASLLAHRIKRYEARTWDTAYRGWVVFHAGTALATGMDDLIEHDARFRRALVRLASRSMCGYRPRNNAEMLEFVRQLPRSAFVGAGRLTGVIGHDDVEPGSFNTLDAVLSASPGDAFLHRYRDAVAFRSPPSYVEGRLNLWEPPSEVGGSLRSLIMKAA